MESYSAGKQGGQENFKLSINYCLSLAMESYSAGKQDDGQDNFKLSINYYLSLAMDSYSAGKQDSFKTSINTYALHKERY